MSISPGIGDLPSYGIDLNGDGLVDFTLSSSYLYQGFVITPTGNNAVLSYVVDSFGSSFAANLSPGTLVGPQSSLSPVWQQTIVFPTGTIYPVITAGYSDGVYGQFAGAAGFVGLQFMVGNETHYGFLQIDCLGYAGDGGFYEGYGWNTTPGAPITTTFVPEPGNWALLGLGAATLWLKRSRR